MKSQTATATIDSASSCAGDTVMVPVNVTDFIDIGAMTLFFGYDTNSAEFISLANINPIIPGAMTVNDNDGQVGVAYSYIVGFTLSNGKLFDLRYLLNSDSTGITFDPGTEIANTNLEVIPLETADGGIYNALSIIEQPDSVQAYPDTDVTFIVTASGNNLVYQWEENTGSGWLDLQNNTTYSGVETETLTIHDVELGFNGNLYRCLVSSGNCEVYTDSALLEVNTAYPATTIGQVTSCPQMTILSPVFAGDLFDVVEFTFNISYDINVVDFISIQNIHPELQAGTLVTTPLNDPDGISVHWENSESVSITSGKLFDMEFSYLSLNTPLDFIEGTEIINSLSNIINATFTDGSVNQQELPVILTQPQSQTIQLNDQAIFSVEATGVEAYQWQVSTDEGQNWTDLSNTTPYSNVNTQELTIDPVTWDLNDYQYSCMLSGEYCLLRTDAATLSVDTLIWTGPELNTDKDWLIISPNPTKDIANLEFWSASSNRVKINIYTISGTMVYSREKQVVQQGINNVQIDLENIDTGLYIVSMEVLGHTNARVKHTKMIKVSD